MGEKPKNLLKKEVDRNKYQFHVTITTIDSTIESENVDEKDKHMEYVENVMNLAQENIGVNLVMLKDLRITTSGNKHIDEFIQQSQLNAVHYSKYLEWILFEKFQNVTYIADGGF
ncbi:hypothetical protein RhiirC2_732872, partial [Rhizophagus irregularis]